MESAISKLSLTKLKQIDANHDGKVSKAELEKALVKAHLAPRRAKQYAKDFCGYMGDPCELKAFIAEYVRMSLFKLSRDIEKNWNLIDKKHKGKISTKQLVGYLKKHMDSKGAKQQADLVFKEADTNHDHFLTKKEVHACYTSHAKKVRSKQAKARNARKTGARKTGARKKKAKTADQKAAEEKKAARKAEEEKWEKEQEERRARLAKLNAERKAKREAEEAKKKAAEEAEEAALNGGADGVRHVDIKLIQKAMDRCYAEKKVPLILDSSGRASTFLTYSGDNVFLNAHELVVKIAFQHQPKEKVLDEVARPKLVQSLKKGRRLIIDMKETACDFTQYTDAKYFPADAVFTHPSPCLQEEVWGQFVTAAEKRDQFAAANPEFSVAIVSEFEYEDAVDFLHDSLPLDKLAIIIVNKAK